MKRRLSRRRATEIKLDFISDDLVEHKVFFEFKETFIFISLWANELLNRCFCQVFSRHDTVVVFVVIRKEHRFSSLAKPLKLFCMRTKKNEMLFCLETDERSRKRILRGIYFV